MHNGPKLAAMVAALIVPLSMAQAAPMQVQTFERPALIDVRPTGPMSIPDNFRSTGTPTEPGGAFKPMLIDGSQEEARVDFADQGSSEPDDERPGLQTRQFELQVALSCKISGDDLIIANIGEDSIAAGSTIKWQVKGSGQKGYLAMQSDVFPGKGFKARGVVEGAEGDRCSAKGV